MGWPLLMRPPEVAFIAPREGGRTLNDAVSRVSGSLVTRLTSRGAMKATFVGHVTLARLLFNAKAGRAEVPILLQLKPMLRLMSRA